MKRIFKQWWCGFWHGHSPRHEMYRDLSVSEDVKIPLYFHVWRCARCGKKLSQYVGFDWGVELVREDPCKKS